MRTITIVIRFEGPAYSPEATAAVNTLRDAKQLVSITEGNERARTEELRRLAPSVRSLVCPMEESPEAALLDVIESPTWGGR